MVQALRLEAPGTKLEGHNFLGSPNTCVCLCFHGRPCFRAHDGRDRFAVALARLPLPDSSRRFGNCQLAGAVAPMRLPPDGVPCGSQAEPAPRPCIAILSLQWQLPQQVAHPHDGALRTDSSATLIYVAAKKNVTLSLPEPLLRKFRVYAAERNQSMTALMTEAIRKMTEEETDREKEKAKRRFFERLKNPPGKGPGDNIPWKREDLYDRGVR